MNLPPSGQLPAATPAAAVPAAATGVAVGRCDADPVLRLIGALASAGLARVHNARGGFACNSSSSHSIVVVPPGVTVRGEAPDYDTDYGWDDFVLTEPGDKIRYLSAMLRRRRAAFDALAPFRARYGVVDADSATVDHQSVLTFPNDVRSDGPHLEFITDLAELLTDPRIAILGGNDNNESSGSRNRGAGMAELTLPNFGEWRARKDTTDDGSWWVLFNTADGTKVRISLNVDAIRASTAPAHQGTAPHASAFTPAKAAAPELVDVKLTDACVYESSCGFCYMGSTRDGQPGDVAAVATVLAALAEHDVFEVAFGGGEPTLWPHFGATLEYTRSLGIIPNFTTKNFSWLTGPHADTWLELVGAVAFSVNTARDADRLAVKSADLSYAHRRKVSIQMIPDLVAAAELRHIWGVAADNRWRVTLLGYKHTGRGSSYTPAFASREPGWWIGQLRQFNDDRAAQNKSRLTTVAIDTALAVQSHAALQSADVPAWTYHRTEGTFSAYIDAVTGRIGPSSYADPTHFTDLNLTADAADLATEIGAAFATYQPGRPSVDAPHLPAPVTRGTAARPPC